MNAQFSGLDKLWNVFYLYWCKYNKGDTSILATSLPNSSNNSLTLTAQSGQMNANLSILWQPATSNHIFTSIQFMIVSWQARIKNRSLGSSHLAPILNIRPDLKLDAEVGLKSRWPGLKLFAEGSRIERCCRYAMCVSRQSCSSLVNAPPEVAAEVRERLDHEVLDWRELPRVKAKSLDLGGFSDVRFRTLKERQGRFRIVYIGYTSKNFEAKQKSN